MIPAGEPGRASTFIRLAGFYAAYFFIVGIVLPFWPVWLDHKGLGPAEIGSVLAVVSWLKLVAYPIAARIADITGRVRATAILSVLGALAGYAALSMAQGYWAILVLYALTSAMLSPSVPLVESVTLRSAERLNLDYGRIRLWGSIAFIVASIGGGAWLTDRSPDWILGIVLTGVAALLAITVLLPNPERDATSGSARPSVRQLLVNRRFMLFLIAAGCLQASHGVYYAFGTLHWQDVGLSRATIGQLWAVGVVAEIGLFAIAGRFGKHLHPTALLILAAAGGIIRWPLLAWSDDPMVLFPSQLLHALTFGAAHLGAMGFLARAVPSGLSATGQSIYYASGGLFMGASMPLAGVLYGALGSSAYLAAAAASLAGLIGALVLAKVWRQDVLSIG